LLLPEITNLNEIVKRNLSLRADDDETDVELLPASALNLNVYAENTTAVMNTLLKSSPKIDTERVQRVQSDENRLVVQRQSLATESVLTGIDDFFGTGHQRVSLLPTSPKYQPLFDMYKTLVDLHWSADTICFDSDIVAYKLLPLEVRHLLEKVFAVFNIADGLVNDNLARRFYDDVKNFEARAFYTFQMAQETVHAHVYALTVQMLVEDADRRAKLLSTAADDPHLLKKIQWAKRWIDDAESPFPDRLVAFAALEGISFQGQFAVICWLPTQKNTPMARMTGIIQANEYIRRDEGKHYQFAIALLRQLSKASWSTPERMTQIITELVDIDIEYMCDALPERLSGMNAEMMTAYIQYVANYVLADLGVVPVYDCGNKCPFPFMDVTSLGGNNDFFTGPTSGTDYTTTKRLDAIDVSALDIDLSDVE
jgi:ribonucleotide reductase beta subunit family protein with ferritin-like domain